MRRTVFINKIKQGSKFRLVGNIGGNVGGGKKPYTFPTLSISIHPDYANFKPLIPLSPQWQTLRQAYLGPGTADPEDYITALERFQNELEQIGQDNPDTLLGALLTPITFDETHYIGTIDENGNIIQANP